MISTVTTSTITTITTMGALGLVATIGALVAVSLIGFLVSRELVTTTLSTQNQQKVRFLDIAIVPMMITFAAIVIFKVVEILA